MKLCNYKQISIALQRQQLLDLRKVTDDEVSLCWALCSQKINDIMWTLHRFTRKRTLNILIEESESVSWGHIVAALVNPSFRVPTTTIRRLIILKKMPPPVKLAGYDRAVVTAPSLAMTS